MLFFNNVLDCVLHVLLSFLVFLDFLRVNTHTEGEHTEIHMHVCVGRGVCVCVCVCVCVKKTRVSGSHASCRLGARRPRGRPRRAASPLRIS